MRYLLCLLAFAALVGHLSAEAPRFKITAAPTPRFTITTAPLPARSFSDMRAQAVKESKPLCVWIGYKCPSSANQLPGMLHWFAPGDTWQGRRGPAVEVLVPGGNGHIYFGETIKAEDCCAANLRAAVERTLARWQRQARPVITLPPAPVSLYGGGGMGRVMMPASFRHVRGWALSRDGQCVD